MEAAVAGLKGGHKYRKLSDDKRNARVFHNVRNSLFRIKHMSPRARAHTLHRKGLNNMKHGSLACRTASLPLSKRQRGLKGTNGESLVRLQSEQNT